MTEGMVTTTDNDVIIAKITLHKRHTCWKLVENNNGRRKGKTNSEANTTSVASKLLLIGKRTKIDNQDHPNKEQLEFLNMFNS